MQKCYSEQLESSGAVLDTRYCMQAAAKQLQELLERELGWDMTASDLQGDTDDEDAPVIVEL